MKKYYIIREDGSSLFALPYPKDFIFHCLVKLVDITDEQFTLMSVDDTSALPRLVTLPYRYLKSECLVHELCENCGGWAALL